MPRSYDASGRREQARSVRRRILDAAVELHGRGITAFGPLAEAAGVPLATLRKHFPNREELFGGCTQHFFADFEPPALARAAALAEPGARLQLIAAEMCRVHEATHALVFHSAPLVAESPNLAAALEALDALSVEAARALVDGPGLELGKGARTAARKRARALLDSLTYRAFRVQAGLAAKSTRNELTALLGKAVGLSLPNP